MLYCKPEPVGVAIEIDPVEVRQSGWVMPITGRAGSPVMVTVTEAEQPFMVVNVISEVPAFTPDTSPLPSTVATERSAETQAIPAAGVPVAESCVFAPTHAVAVPLMAGNPLTVTTAVC